MGYITIELIAFKNYNNTSTNESLLNYWSIDLKFGLNDLLSSILFCQFIYNHAQDKLQMPDYNINLSINQISDKCKIFTFPFIANQKISEIKMKDLVKAFRNENLIFDVEKKKGIVFNFSDTLECGNMGILGILNLEELEITNEEMELWKMIQSSVHIVAIAVKINEFQPNVLDEQRTDAIDMADIYTKVNKYYNNLLIHERNERMDRRKESSSVMK